MEKDIDYGLRIKYRGKSIYDGHWMYGYFISIEKDRYAIVPAFNDIELGHSISSYEAILETVGQFTGKTDRNGKEIYAGDIVRVYSKDGTFDIVVKWSNDSMAFMACYADGNQSPFSWFSNLLTYELEVIGNIYDNKELSIKANGKNRIVQKKG